MSNETVNDFLERIGIDRQELNLVLNFAVTAAEVFAPIMQTINDVNALEHYEKIKSIARRLKESQLKK